MTHLLDTNALSEPFRPQPDAQFLKRYRAHAGEMAISDCARGTACVDNNDSIFYCKPFCTVDRDCKPFAGDGACSENLYDGSRRLAGKRFCAADHPAHLL